MQNIHNARKGPKWSKRFKTGPNLFYIKGVRGCIRTEKNTCPEQRAMSVRNRLEGYTSGVNHQYL